MNYSTNLSWLFSFLLCACNTGAKQEQKNIQAELSVPVHIQVLDSLQKRDDLGELQKRVYEVDFFADSIERQKGTLTLYNYSHSGDGVYELNDAALFRDYGRMYTLRGYDQNQNAVVYQLRSFFEKKPVDFLYQGDTLILL